MGWFMALFYPHTLHHFQTPYLLKMETIQIRPGSSPPTAAAEGWDARAACARGLRTGFIGMEDYTFTTYTTYTMFWPR